MFEPNIRWSAGSRREYPTFSEQEYFPFDLVSDPTALGLVEDTAETKFGRLHLVRSQCRTSEEATLFLHGVGSSWTTWTPVLRAAQEVGRPQNDVLLPDLPGFGQSENHLCHLRSDEAGRALEEIVHALGYTRVRLVGHSMGGFLALDMATRLDSITSVHIAAGAYFTIIDAIQRPIASLARAPHVASVYGSQRILARLGIGNGLFDGRRAYLVKFLLGPVMAHPTLARPGLLTAINTEARPRSFLLAERNGIGYDARRRWSGLMLPVIAAFGAKDRLVPPRDMGTLGAVLPSSRSTMIRDASHFVHIERPYETIEALDL